MTIDLQRNDELGATISLVIERSDYQPKLEEITRNYSKKVNLKGFRSGKTPRSVLNKMYGKDMLQEAVTSILNDKLYAYIEEQGLDHFGSPILNPDSPEFEFDPKNETDYTFVFDLGLKPRVDIALQVEDEVQIVVPEVDQAALDEEIIRYRRYFGEDEEITDGTIGEHDKIMITLQRELGDGKLEETKAENTVSLTRLPEESKKTLIGKKTGDQLSVDLESFFPFDREQIIKQIVQVEEDPAPGEPLTYQLTIDKISRPQQTP